MFTITLMTKMMMGMSMNSNMTSFKVMKIGINWYSKQTEHLRKKMPAEWIQTRNTTIQSRETR